MTSGPPTPSGSTSHPRPAVKSQTVHQVPSFASLRSSAQSPHATLSSASVDKTSAFAEQGEVKSGRALSVGRRARDDWIVSGQEKGESKGIFSFTIRLRRPENETHIHGQCFVTWTALGEVSSGVRSQISQVRQPSRAHLAIHRSGQRMGRFHHLLGQVTQDSAISPAIPYHSPQTDRSQATQSMSQPSLTSRCASARLRCLWLHPHHHWTRWAET